MKLPYERLGVAACALLALSTIVAQGLWRPLVVALHTGGSALGVTGAAMVVAGVACLVYARTWSAGASQRRSGAVAAIVAAAFGVLLGVPLGAGRGLAAIGAATLSLVFVALFSGALLPNMVPRLPVALDGLARRRAALVLLVLANILAVAQTARLSTFMGDAARTDLSVMPSVPFLVQHSCLTAYVEGARLATQRVDNVYEAENWPDLSHSARSAVYAARYAPFNLDAFEYPPPFLLLPRAVLWPFDDFASQRAVWFALNALSLALGLFAVARWVGGRTEYRALLLAPVVWLAPVTVVILQVGNVHATVIVLAMLAMVAFESDRPALGGALLAFAILSKISPGLLVVMLLVRRRFREVLWTAGFGLVFVALGALVFGVAPYKAFLFYQLPRLASGEALRFMTGGESLPINMAPFGVPFKLAFLGVSIGEPWRVAKVINGVFTVVLLALTVAAARREGTPATRAMSWLAVLTLGTLRSPFAPGYVVLPALWILSLLSGEVRSRAGAVKLTLVWGVLAITLPISPRQLVLNTLVQQCVFIGLLVYLLLRPSDVSVPARAPGRT